MPKKSVKIANAVNSATKDADLRASSVGHSVESDINEALSEGDKASLQNFGDFGSENARSKTSGANKAKAVKLKVSTAKTTKPNSK